MKALDEAIKGFAAGYQADSYGGQPPPAGLTPAPSTLTPVDTKTDTFAPESAPMPAARDPLLDAKGGGGLSGGVVNDYLGARGGGGLSGGVVNDSR